MLISPRIVSGLKPWLTQDFIMWIQMRIQPELCEIYWEKINTVPDPHLFFGGQWEVPIFEIGSEKNEYLGELKESIPQIFMGGFTVFLVKKDCKIK